MKILYDYAMSFLNTPYRWGGDDPMTGFDCSGFVQELLASVGIDPPRDQTAQALHDHFILDGYSWRRETGALIFYGKNGRVNHVAFALTENLVIEAAGGGSRTRTLKDAVRDNAWIRIRPYNYRPDIIRTILPQYPSWIYQTPAR